MKKVMHKILGFVVMVGLLPLACWADETNIDALQYVGGTVPIIRRVEVSGPGYTNFFPVLLPMIIQLALRHLRMEPQP